MHVAAAPTHENRFPIFFNLVHCTHRAVRSHLRVAAAEHYFEVHLAGTIRYECFEEVHPELWVKVCAGAHSVQAALPSACLQQALQRCATTKAADAQLPKPVIRIQDACA